MLLEYYYSVYDRCLACSRYEILNYYLNDFDIVYILCCSNSSVFKSVEEKVGGAYSSVKVRIH